MLAFDCVMFGWQPVDEFYQNGVIDYYTARLTPVTGGKELVEDGITSSFLQKEFRGTSMLARLHKPVQWCGNQNIYKNCFLNFYNTFTQCN